MPSKQLLFIHLPKTGGHTVNDAMAQSFGADQCATFIDGQDYAAKGFFSTRRYYAGHVRLAAVAPYLRRRNFYVFTFIREPVGRLFSHLAWAKKKTRGGAKPDPTDWDDNYLRLFRDIGKLDIASADALHKFTQAHHGYERLFDNQQTRFLVDAPHDGPVSYADFKKALGNLKKFDFAGVTERLSEGLAAIAKANGLKAPRNIGVKNKNPWRKDYGLERIDPAIRGAVVEYTKYDALLHDAARELLDKRRR
jgi:hypothetical protein